MSAPESTIKRKPRTFQVRHYTDSEKALALVALEANEGNVNRTAKQLKIPRLTLRDWSLGKKTSSDVSGLQQLQRKALAERLEDLAHLAIDLLPGKMPEAAVRELVGVFGQSIEKKQLLTGEPTSITESRGEKVEKVEKVAGKLLQLVRKTG